MSDPGRPIRDYDYDDYDPVLDDEQEDETGPQVIWTLDLDDAELLWDFLHRHRPGGYQHVHDGLLEAINQARGTTLFGRFLASVDGEQYPDIDRGFISPPRPGPER